MELQHHGILGQKWGVRNGPPYPLERTRKNAKAYRKALHATNEQIAEKKVSIQRTNKKIEKAKAAGDKQTVKELSELGKKELKSMRSLEIQRQNIVKDAKSGGFVVQRTKHDVQYDGRSQKEKNARNAGEAVAGIAGGLVGISAYALTDYLIANGMGYLIELPMYSVKVPKEQK